MSSIQSFFFFFNDTATTAIYTLSLHDALPIFDTMPHAGMPAMFFVTSVHCAPLSLVYQTLPSFVPAQISPFSTSDVAIAKITSGANWPRLSPTMPPDAMILPGSCVERSGLITFQLCPPLFVWKMTLHP